VKGKNSKRRIHGSLSVCNILLKGHEFFAYLTHIIVLAGIRRLFRYKDIVWGGNTLANL
jgi:hypothetical protein